jgi:hypothetical protein
MAKMTFQKLSLTKERVGEPFEVQFNPTQFGLTRTAQFAEISIPGLEQPVVQFIRGDSERMTLELFFDTTDGGTGPLSIPVTTRVDPFYRLVKIDGDTHAPPIVRLTWGDNFPGVTTDQSNRPIPVLDCVVESVQRQFTLFSPDGIPLRATVTLALREYRTLEEQLQSLNKRSADHTRVHVVRQGETLAQIAYDAYRDAARWRLIADHNNILTPRRLAAGTVLELPPVS